MSGERPGPSPAEMQTTYNNVIAEVNPGMRYADGETNIARQAMGFDGDPAAKVGGHETNADGTTTNFTLDARGGGNGNNNEPGTVAQETVTYGAKYGETVPAIGRREVRTLDSGDSYSIDDRTPGKVQVKRVRGGEQVGVVPELSGANAERAAEIIRGRIGKIATKGLETATAQRQKSFEDLDEAA